MEREVEVLLEQAGRRMHVADWRGAIDLLRRALAIDPDHARAHAALALALRGAKRLAAAAIEVQLALHLDGNDAYCHYAAAAVFKAQRKLAVAWQHCLVALETDATDPDTYVLGAGIRELQNEPAAARELITRALELEPNHTASLTALARLELHERHYDDATRAIEQALRSSPGDTDAHVVAGYIDLYRGDDAGAEGHARFALQQDATERDALALWAAIKAHRSPLIGAWWRINAFLSVRGEASQIGLLVASYVAVQIAIIVAAHFGFDALEGVLRFCWLGFCGYTWIAPSVFKRMLERDLGRVELDPEF